MRLVEGVAHVDTGHERSFDSLEALLERLDEIAGETTTICQAFDARYVVSTAHLERALELADRARGRGEAIARARGVELLLYAAGRRQIDQALEMGIDAGRTPAVVAVAADGEHGDEPAAEELVRETLEPAATLDSSEHDHLRAFFEISDAELAATSADLEALVLERVALLVVDR